MIFEIIIFICLIGVYYKLNKLEEVLNTTLVKRSKE